MGIKTLSIKSPGDYTHYCKRCHFYPVGDRTDDVWIPVIKGRIIGMWKWCIRINYDSRRLS